MVQLKGEWHDGYFDPETAEQWNIHIKHAEDPFRLTKGGLYDRIRGWVSKNNLKGAGDCIDVCCGEGITSKVLADATGGKVSGVDLSQPLIAIAQADNSGSSNLDFKVGDVSDLSGFRDGEFAAATMINGIFHLPPDTMVRSVSELSRVSRGPILITHVNIPAYDFFASMFDNREDTIMEAEGLEQTPVVIGDPSIKGPGEDRLVLKRTPFVMHPFENFVVAFEKAGLILEDSRTFGPVSADGGSEKLDLFVAMELTHKS